MEFSSDPLINAVYGGIKRGVRVTLDKKCYRSVLVLVYAGIDAMATLGMPVSQDEVVRRDFIDWVDRYIRVGDLARITGEEFYSARCGLIHSYTLESSRTRRGKARMVGYMVGEHPPIRYDPGIDPNLVLLDIPTLAEAFLESVDRFLVEAVADPQRRPVVEARLQKMPCISPYP